MHDLQTRIAGFGSSHRQDPGSVRLSFTLSAYIAKHAALGIAIAMFALGMIAVVVDLIELLRRSSSRPDATFAVVFQMAWLHLPFFLQKLLPFAVLFGAMFSFQRLTRSHELVAARAVGVSVWQFLMPALTVSILLGVFMVTILNPIGAVLIAKYENMERNYFSNSSALVTVSLGGLWLRQQSNEGELLLHARQMTRTPPKLSNVTVFFFDEQKRFTARADAETANLELGYWNMVKPIYAVKDGSARLMDSMKIPTDLT
ncbi:MAG: LptF/LptG family permease, partial [Geminicoccaceae bacterium]